MEILKRIAVRRNWIRDTDGIVDVFSPDGADIERKVEFARPLLLRKFCEVTIGLGRQSDSGTAPADMQLGSIETRISRDRQEFVDTQRTMEEVELHAVTVEVPFELIDALEKRPPQGSVQGRDGGSGSCRSAQEILKSCLKSRRGPGHAEHFRRERSSGTTCFIVDQINRLCRIGHRNSLTLKALLDLEVDLFEAC